MKSWPLLLILIFIIFFSLGAFTETVTLKNGRTVSAPLLEKTDEFFVLDVWGVPIKYYHKDIESVITYEESLQQSNRDNSDPDVFTYSESKDAVYQAFDGLSRSDTSIDWVHEDFPMNDPQNSAASNLEELQRVDDMLESINEEIDDDFAIGGIMH
tara:strand:+ start:393 stop:860 length:468 start_codon:yes stop_codon:yes gene_type:complete